ncbi:MAG: hypothetical protein CM1200mP30_13670 [Pseudomonadota bacterium]|nr:MAG: hypothetical protein CM1200mP30_13670 [Pseudomonadota bacterium]
MIAGAVGIMDGSPIPFTPSGLKGSGSSISLKKLREHQDWWQYIFSKVHG